MLTLSTALRQNQQIVSECKSDTLPARQVVALKVSTLNVFNTGEKLACIAGGNRCADSHGESYGS